MTVDASIANLDEDESLEPRDSTLKAVLGATLQISDMEQLSKILTKIERLPNVLEAFRLSGSTQMKTASA